MEQKITGLDIHLAYMSYKMIGVQSLQAVYELLFRGLVPEEWSDLDPNTQAMYEGLAVRLNEIMEMKVR